MNEQVPLYEQLQGVVEQFKLQAPQEVLDNLAKSVSDLIEKEQVSGLVVGSKAPNFTLKDATGKEVTLSEEVAKGPVILTFYRGGWCPFCNLELQAYKKHMDTIKEQDAQLIAVSPESPDNSLSSREKHDLPFYVLSDTNSHVSSAYKVAYEVPEYLAETLKGALGLDLIRYNDADVAMLPVPATYIIDKEGIIQLAFVNPDYTSRLEPTKAIEVLNNLK
ncbi:MULTISPECIES: peroxiredoxin-like family protein [Bacillales]|uniref:peroxiredoxin-like family protein n=1 Tax=Bacillales TaxID=1385 RepID=UPI001E543623|nr:peroxiredoxin-like family protein [Metabacillus sp. B2-18]UGB30973.1 AhpC/TSA family protein [Metabacillus sp. B2-18]